MDPQNGNGADIKKLIVNLFSVIEEKDSYTKGHSERVAANCVLFSRHLGLSQHEIEKIYLAGLLHDIGMVYIPDEIKIKDGELDKDEMLIIKRHPLISEKILSKYRAFHKVLPIIRHHHESFDGSGYPDGIGGKSITTETSILSIVNCYEAMVSCRSNKKASSSKEALNFINANADHQFEPNLAKEFLKFMEPSAEAVGESDETEETIIEKTEAYSEEQIPPNNGEMNSVEEIINKTIKKALKGKIEIPVLSNVVNEIQKVMAKPTSTVEDVAGVIEQDAAISLKLISTANSPMYRGTEKIQLVSQAIPRIGVKESQSIVTAIASKSLYQSKDKALSLIMEKLWAHSLACAYASKLIAAQQRLPDNDKYFLMGLVHDIGKPPLMNVFTEILNQDESLSIDDIMPKIQEAHTNFGATILKRWGFTQDFQRIAARHESSSFLEGTETELLIISLANTLAKNIGYGTEENEEIDLSELDAMKLLKIDSKILDPLCEKTLDFMKETSKIF